MLLYRFGEDICSIQFSVSLESFTAQSSDRGDSSHAVKGLSCS